VTSYADSGRRVGARRRRRAQAGEIRRTRPLAGVAWIAVLAVLLAGVVAVNVAVLQLTMRVDGANRDKAGLQADIARLESERSSEGSSYRVQQLAQEKLGVVQADPSTTTYVELPAR